MGKTTRIDKSKATPFNLLAESLEQSKKWKCCALIWLETSGQTHIKTPDASADDLVWMSAYHAHHTAKTVFEDGVGGRDT